MTRADKARMNNLKLTRLRQASASLKTTNLGRKALEQLKQCLDERPVWGAGHALFNCAPWSGFREWPWFPALLFYWDSVNTASRKTFQLLLALGRLAVGLGSFIAAPAVFAEEFIELAIPLKESRFYSPRDFCAASNEKLGTRYRLDQIPDRLIELTALERAALALANEAGLLKGSITGDQIVISVPNHEDDRVRRRQRERLERLFHIPLTAWPTDKGLRLPDDFAPERRTMLLIHGLEADACDLQRFQEACRRSDIQFLYFDYPNDGPIAWSGDRLRQQLNELSVQQPKLRLVIVAHSMGGLVARYALEAADRSPAAVTHLFMLGTPNHGSRFAGAQSWLELLLAIPTGRFLGPELMRDGLNEAADDLRPDSMFLKELNSRRRPAAVQYFSAIGRRSFLSNTRREQITSELEELFRRRKTAPEHRAAVLGALAADELRDGLGDGAVTVTSARFPNTADERLFDLNHVELLALPGAQPEQASVFDWIMRSLHWSRRND